MKVVLSFVLIVTAILASGGSFAALSSEPSRELIVCGWAEVFILDMNAQPPSKLWSWKAAEHSEMPALMRDKFRTTDECKPVDGGARILITSSSDGIALVERASGKVLFYGTAGGAHSAEMLPNGRLVVASSTSKSKLSDRLVLFDILKSGQPLFDTELVSGHGVVWDDRRQVLWTLSGRYLRTYKLADWNTEKPQLAQGDEYQLPDASGHDLSPLPGTSLLSITTLHSAWVFDRDKRVFAPHRQFANQANIKCITVHPVTKETVWTRADDGFWWTATLRFLDPEGSFEMKGERLYKARWVVAP